ncbi:MAG: (2Fe-2S)-binding protein [Candidatus Melainabacteria bacterium]|nr:MAG: (2Fe-2S)-binding protein [Candidatus Melainabacteria bacterium]
MFGIIDSKEGQPMYVCICHAVTEEQIKDFARAHGCNWRKMSRELKAGTDCGTCAIKAKRALKNLCTQVKPADASN